MKLNLLPLAFLLLSIAFACSDDEKETNENKNQEELLTGNTEKHWKIIENSSDEDEEEQSCKTSHPMNNDNRWVFIKGGDFRYDNGDITDDPDCDDDVQDCCSDMLDLFGTWEFSADKKKLIVTAEGKIEDGEETFESPEQIMNATIEKLTENEMILTQRGVTVKFIAE